MKIQIKIIALLFLFAALACSKDDNTPEVVVPVKSDAKAMTSFTFNATDNVALVENVAAIVTEANKTVSTNLVYGTDITALTPTVIVSAKASVSPTGAQDFTSPVTYTVTAEDGTTAAYTVSATVSQSSESALVSFAFLKLDNGTDANIVGAIDNEDNSVRLIMKANTDLVALLPKLEISEGASYTPQGIQDFSEPVTYTVTAGNGSTSEYTISVRTERDLLIAIADANPNNTLGWDYSETDIDFWSGVSTDDEGYVNELELGRYGLSVIPTEIGFLRKLHELDLDGNLLTELPKSIGMLTNLIELELDDNKLKFLPVEFTQLISLNELQLSENLFEEFPEEIFQLTNLIELDLSQNKLKELPSGFNQLTALNELNLDDNPFVEFPQEIFGLPNLVQLRYSRNGLKELPQGIDNLNQLERLYLNDNLLSDLPDELYALDRLRTLELKANQFEHMPEVLFYLEKLTTLHLNNNRITKIPNTIAQSPSLRILHIDDNLLTAIPKEIGTEMSLNRLYIRGNPIAILPDEICERFSYFDYFLIKDETTICKSDA
ncbi:DUF5018 domain-containing protein [Kriegella sp. EG-1]|nr:DUF5018 domain-containing protein [Flavobacteriaceae bacterium EG-1]